MNAKERVEYYLEYCKYRKELDEKTIKAYRIDLKQYFDAFPNSRNSKFIFSPFGTIVCGREISGGMII